MLFLIPNDYFDPKCLLHTSCLWSQQSGKSTNIFFLLMRRLLHLSAKRSQPCEGAIVFDQNLLGFIDHGKWLLIGFHEIMCKILCCPWIKWCHVNSDTSEWASVILCFLGPKKLNYNVLVFMQWQCFILSTDSNLSPYLIMCHLSTAFRFERFFFNVSLALNRDDLFWRPMISGESVSYHWTWSYVLVSTPGGTI